MIADGLCPLHAVLRVVNVPEEEGQEEKRAVSRSWEERERERKKLRKEREREKGKKLV